MASRPLGSFRIEVLDLANNVLLGTVPNARNLKFGYVLNAPGACDYALPLRIAGRLPNPNAARAVHKPNARKIRVYRTPPGGGAETREWGGYLWPRELEDQDNLRFAAQGLYSRLRWRHLKVDKTYRIADGISADQVNIAWNVVQAAQADESLGFTRDGTDASNASGIKRDLDLCAYDRPKVGEVVEDLAGGDDSFDYDVDQFGKWRTWSPRRGSVKAITLNVDAENVILESYTEGGEGQATEFTGMGPCHTCDGETRLYDVVSGSQQAIFGLLQDSGRYEVKAQEHMRSLTREDARHAKYPHEQAVVKLMGAALAGWWRNFDIGDVVALDSDLLDINAQPMRVVAWEVDNTDGIQAVRATLDSVTA